MELAIKQLIPHKIKALLELPKSTTEDSSSNNVDDGFLPNFCEGNTLLHVAIIAQMLAIIITLVTRRLFASHLHDLVYISLFVQWIALSSAAILCMTRKHLNKLSHSRAVIMSFLLVMCVTMVISELALWVLWASNNLSNPRPIWYSYYHIQNLSLSAIVNGLALRYFFARQELRQRTLSEGKAKIQVLRSRIRPHFVFNTMNIIASLVRSDANKAEEAIEDMSEIFRMMLNEHENLVPIKNEIEVAKKYIAIEVLRFGERLSIDWDVAKFPRKAIMPVLTLQPLLENMIQNSIETSTKGGAIAIKLWEEDDKIYINILGTLPPSKRKSQEEDSTLIDIRHRLQSHYGDAAHFTTAKDNNTYTIDVIIPIRGVE